MTAPSAGGHGGHAAATRGPARPGSPKEAKPPPREPGRPLLEGGGSSEGPSFGGGGGRPAPAPWQLTVKINVGSHSRALLERVSGAWGLAPTSCLFRQGGTHPAHLCPLKAPSAQEAVAVLGVGDLRTGRVVAGGGPLSSWACVSWHRVGHPGPWDGRLVGRQAPDGGSRVDREAGPGPTPGSPLQNP